MVYIYIYIIYILLYVCSIACTAVYVCDGTFFGFHWYKLWFALYTNPYTVQYQAMICVGWVQYLSLGEIQIELYIIIIVCGGVVTSIPSSKSPIFFLFCYCQCCFSITLCDLFKGLGRRKLYSYFLVVVDQQVYNILI